MNVAFSRDGRTGPMHPLGWLAWVIVAFLALNTLANFAAPHPVARWVMGSITLAHTLALTGIGLTIALRAPDLT
jgi:hypothetical protein